MKIKIIVAILLQYSCFHEIQNCINKDFIITTPDMNEMEKLSIQLKNTILSTKCNINSISSKIKAANIV